MRKEPVNVAKLIRTRPLDPLGLKAASSTRADTTLAEVPYRGLVNFRIDVVAHKTHVDLLSASLGIKLPMAANTITQSDTARCLWLGPDEWLIINSAADGGEMVDALVAELGSETHYSAKDLSQNYQTIRLEGPHARDVLSKLTPLDVDSSVFTAGQCAQTVMAKSAIILDVIDDEKDNPTFEITVRRSFATYVWQRLVDAGLEYGVSVASL